MGRIQGLRAETVPGKRPPIRKSLVLISSSDGASPECRSFLRTAAPAARKVEEIPNPGRSLRIGGFRGMTAFSRELLSD